MHGIDSCVPDTNCVVFYKERIMEHTMKDIIAARAYDIFLARGQEHGRDFDDWFEAERQVYFEQLSAAALRNKSIRKTAKMPKRKRT